VTAASVTYRLAIAPGGEPQAQRFYETLNADLEARDATEAVSISYYEDGPHGWIVEVIGAELPGVAVIRAAARKAVGDPTGFPPFSVARMPEIDWVSHSQQGLPPVRAGSFVIHGSHDRDRVHGRRLGIQIDAGEAFGTAHHGTTLGCLIALDWLARRQGFGNVLDVGTGTGVLAIAAAKRGAQVLATDIDETAVRVAEANVALNSANHAVTCLRADGLRHPAIRTRAPYDLVLANILAEPLMGMANPVRRGVAPGGVVVLSGILRNQGWRVISRFNAAGFVLLRRIDRAGWTTLIMMRRCDLPAG